MEENNSESFLFKEINIFFYSLEISVEKEIQKILKNILEEYEKSNLFHSIYSVVFESTVNSLKAIGKRVYFLENNLDIENPDDYEKGILGYKKELLNNKLNYYSSKGEQYGLYTSVKFSYKTDGLKIEVISNCLILEEENRRIRQKLKEGMKYETLVSFYDSNADQTEGEGLGLVLSTLVLKSIGINPSDFRIGNKNGSIQTRIEIPFEDSYISQRAAYEIAKLRD